MFKNIITGLALGLGGYMIWRYFNNSDTVTTADGEGVGWLDGVTGGFFEMSNTVMSAQGMGISLAGLAHIKKWEGFRANRYLDSAGKPTIGYGHLIKAWESYDTITQAQAEALLVKDVSVAEATVSRLVKVNLTQSQFDALVSLVFNIGSGNFASSTLLKELNAGRAASVPYEMGRWVYAGGVRLDGLVNRRVGDIRVWQGVYA